MIFKKPPYIPTPRVFALDTGVVEKNIDEDDALGILFNLSNHLIRKVARRVIPINWELRLTKFTATNQSR